ncbi:uncharacterized protein LOC143428221 [Xylocopa sonorina]|uniref:uncharacterized protein LOC143428221 n=1 Tax=Xylocopa sonorina TaxID=1818115 RepID=UPI00403A9389
MMVATYKCGCAPGPTDSCSTRCTSRRKTYYPRPQDCSTSSCCRKQPVKPTISPAKVEEPPATCCPTMPSRKFETRQLRSEIAESTLPYDEFEAIINNNRLVIRSQEEPVVPEYVPPCDCIEDSLPKREETREIGQAPASGNRTVILYPRPKYSDPEMATENDRSEEKESDEVRTIDQEENPNIFLLRVKKRSSDGDQMLHIDLEFKTPRPWSRKMRLKHETMMRLIGSVKPSSMIKEKEKGDRSSKKKKKK